VEPSKNGGSRQRPSDEETCLVSKRSQPISETAQDQTENTCQSQVFQRAEHPLQNEEQQFAWYICQYDDRDKEEACAEQNLHVLN
jgi:hypothetical protein